MRLSDTTKNFCIVNLLTLTGYGIFRFIGWYYYANTVSWHSINSDYWHHWELAIIFIIFAAVVLKGSSFWQNIIYAIASGQIIDELTYAIFPQETISNFWWQLRHWYWLVGFEVIFFLLLCFAIYRLNSGTKKSRRNIRVIILVVGIIAITILIYTDLIKNL